LCKRWGVVLALGALLLATVPPLVLLPTSPVLAATTQDVTVTANPAGFGVDPPSDFSATYVTDTRVALSWDKGIGAQNTMIRARVGEWPSDRTDGYQVYYSTGEYALDTGVDLGNTLVPVYYRAWSESGASEWSTDYDQDSVWPILVGGEGVTLLSTTFQGFVYLLPLLIFSILAFWRLNPVLFLIAGAVGLMSGLSIPDLLAGNTSSDLSLSLGLLVVAYGLACVVFAYVTLFRIGDTDAVAQ
jgi:hypothetical protein